MIFQVNKMYRLVVFYVPSTARSPPFTVPCKGREARFYTVPTGYRTPGRRVAVHYTTAAPRKLHLKIPMVHCLANITWEYR